jgi:hypothetical protein
VPLSHGTFSSAVGASALITRCLRAAGALLPLMYLPLLITGRDGAVVAGCEPGRAGAVGQRMSGLYCDALSPPRAAIWGYAANAELKTSCGGCQAVASLGPDDAWAGFPGAHGAPTRTGEDSDVLENWSR